MMYLFPADNVNQFTAHKAMREVERGETVKKNLEMYRGVVCGDEGDSYSLANWFTCAGVRGTLKPG